MSNARAVYTKVVSPKKLIQVDLVPWNLFPYVMTVLVLLTAVSLFHVWSRVRLIELNLTISEGAKTLKDERQENGRLRLEVASLKSPARIEALAKGDLGMVLPADQQMVLVK